MISVKEIEEIHKILVDKFGGVHGIRDLGGLESALARPFQSFGNEELYPSPVLKAAALLGSILINHPFIDGNKRTAYTIVRLFLLSNDFDIKASQDEKYDFIVSTASGKKDFAALQNGWHLIQKKTSANKVLLQSVQTEIQSTSLSSQSSIKYATLDECSDTVITWLQPLTGCSKKVEAQILLCIT